ncbi:hypothetical protein HDU86_002094 [Geranomyces michiganensis]|nr:hypothetical protein HDU86_002094 [Geranomyces michiganensis]
MAGSDETITAVDYLAQQEELLQEASEVLPCHTSCADVVELFYKRHFRCDCGTARLPNKCTLTSPLLKIPEEQNTENAYGPNFRGEFCFCRTLYNPDTEAGVMFQCILCEDWMHDRCIGALPSWRAATAGQNEEEEDAENEDLNDEYICRGCVGKHPFLTRYQRFKQFEFVGPGVKKDGEAVLNDDAGDEPKTAGPTEERKRARETDETDETIEPASVKKHKPDDESTTSSPRHSTCIIRSIAPIPAIGGVFPDLFCNDGWRLTLCRCNECIKMYASEGIPFILIQEEAYEPDDDENAGASLHDIGVKHLNVMKRDEAINGVLAYQKMKSDLTAFFKTFADEGRTVTEADVKAYFAEKEANRRKM